VDVLAARRYSRTVIAWGLWLVEAIRE